MPFMRAPAAIASVASILVGAAIIACTSPTQPSGSSSATKLSLVGQPSTTTAGAAIAPAVVVMARDNPGNRDTSFTGNVTVALGANPGAGTLSGTTTVRAVAGVALFATLSINKAGTGYTLVASSGALPSATTTPFTINPGPLAKLSFTVQPSTTSAGAAMAPAVQVTAQDALGNTVTTFTGNVTMALGANAGAGTLAGTTTVSAVAGVATFANLSIDKAGTGYTLTASSGALPSATSTPFNIFGLTAKLSFTVQPSTTSAGAAIAPAVQVTAQDALGNTVTSFTGNVTVGLGANPGAGSLSGTTTVSAVAGVATFATLSINKPGTGYTLVASSGALHATSTPFTINPGLLTKLSFTVQPSTTSAGAAIAPAVQVTVQDNLGNTVTSFTGNVTMALGANPGAGTLSGTTTVSAVAGVATFATLSINKPGAGYTLVASSGALPSATSTPFTINPGLLTKLSFTVQPSTTSAGAVIAPAVQVTAQDALGNTVTSFTGNVTMALGTNPGAGTLAGTTTVSAVAGVATFATLSINKPGTGYTLVASSGALHATSTPFTINPGPLAKLSFTVQPSTTSAGAVIAPAVQVTAQDNLGNTATSFTGNVTVALGANPSAGTLSGTTTVSAVAGVATFSTLSIDMAGIGYTLVASSGALPSATSTPFTIGP